MSRKHFEALARELRTAWDLAADRVDDHLSARKTWLCTVQCVADACAQANHLFDRARFYAAAGVTSGDHA